MSKISGILANQVSPGIIENYTNYCYVTSLGSIVGGIIGFNRGEIIDCKNYGKITITSSDKYGCFVGSISSNNLDSTIDKCYYLSTLGIGGINKVDIENQAEAKTAEYLKSDELLIVLNSESNNWKKDTKNVNEGYPILSWQ